MEEHFAGRVRDILAGARPLIEVAGCEVGVVAVNGKIHAFENRCAHQGGPVCLGGVFGRLQEILAEDHSVVGERFSDVHMHLVCPWHGWEYDVETGQHAGDERFRLRRFPVVVRGEDAYVIG